MKGYKINLREYRVERPKLKECPYCGKPINEVEKALEDYGIKEVITNVMLHPSQGHGGFRFFTVEKVARKITNAKDSIVLDKAEYETIKECFDKFKGYAKNDGEMVSRIYEAEEVELEEKKKR